MLLQFAHPLIAAGVHEHSSFRAGPGAAARRLQGTVRAMLALTFGDDPTREDALNSIRSIHTRVHGKLAIDVGKYRAGTPYSAEDPDLVLWVHATLLESVLLFYELLVEPLTETERDSYCAEAALIAVDSEPSKVMSRVHGAAFENILKTRTHRDKSSSARKPASSRARSCIRPSE